MRRPDVALCNEIFYSRSSVLVFQKSSKHEKARCHILSAPAAHEINGAGFEKEKLPEEASCSLERFHTLPIISKVSAERVIYGYKVATERNGFVLAVPSLTLWKQLNYEKAYEPGRRYEAERMLHAYRVAPNQTDSAEAHWEF